MMKCKWFAQAAFYRNLTVFTAVTGSLLIWRHGGGISYAAFAAVLFLFAGALVAAAAVLLALRQRSHVVVIQGLLLMLWQIALPLAVLARLDGG
ncbi:hypothetical protein V6667_08865 [Neisseria leonii]|uniref:hypothetical protein n=1 Tax=Neisseria leonii TaxID=2995413 RepID=UPI0030D09B82